MRHLLYIQRLYVTHIVQFYASYNPQNFVTAIISLNKLIQLAFILEVQYVF
jgi:hypothetical protein